MRPQQVNLSSRVGLWSVLEIIVMESIHGHQRNSNKDMSTTTTTTSTKQHDHGALAP